tara:strand:- start:1904 stop:2329 length:426 start_codon:yes stop_codon:yes gene_type:complete
MLAIDFDKTLNLSDNKFETFKPNKPLIDILKNKDFFILTARISTDEDIKEINSFIEEFGLNPVTIVFTEGKEKGPFLERLSEQYSDKYDISTLVDDLEYQRDSAKKRGYIAYSPENFVEENIKKISRLNLINSFYRIGISL